MEESINVTARAAAQLRAFSDVNVTQFGPRTDGPPKGVLWSPIASISCDRRSSGSCLLDCRRQKTLIGSARLALLSAAFTAASADLGIHTLCNYNYASLSNAKARSVMR